MKLVRLDNQISLKEADRLAGGEFLESSIWEELLKKEGEIVERYGVIAGGEKVASAGEELLAIATLVKKPLFGPFFYYYLPRGPIGKKEAVKFLLPELKKGEARRTVAKAVFLRIEPEESLIVAGDFKKSLDLQPKKTLFLDLSLSAEELIAAMHQKTRYNIRLAEKKGVTIVQGKQEDGEEFWRLMSLTSERDGFRLHGKKHYENLLSAPNFIKLFFARYEGKNIATGLFCFFGDRVTYLHGASDNEARNLMAPYLLQWEVIKTAQKEGYRYYDFYGIDETKWPGVTRFKLGFGGNIHEYPGTFDFIFKPFLYGFYEFLRKIRRGL